MPKKKTSSPKQAEKIEPLWIDPPEKIWRFDFGKFSFGLFLVVIGLLYLAKNTGWLPINFQFDIWQLWPMLLIFFGLSFVSGKGLSGLMVGSIFTMTVLVIAAIFISNNIIKICFYGFSCLLKKSYSCFCFSRFIIKCNKILFFRLYEF